MLLGILLTGCLGFTPADAGEPASAEAMMLKGDLELRRQGVEAVFIGMVGIEGPFDAEAMVNADTDHPLGALASPWFRGMVNAPDTALDGRLSIWTSGYTTEVGSFYGLVIPSSRDGVGQLVIGAPGKDGAPGTRAVGGFQPCPAHPSQWHIGSVAAVEAARADPTFAAALQARPDETLTSVLWMGEQVYLGCGAIGPPFWWIAYGDLAPAITGPTRLTVATVDAMDGTLSVADEWLRLRPTEEHVLHDAAVQTPATTATIHLGDVLPLATSAVMELTYDAAAGPLMFQYDLAIVGPHGRSTLPSPTVPVGAGRLSWSIDDPPAGEYALEITASNGQALATTVTITFTAMQ